MSERYIKQREYDENGNIIKELYSNGDYYNWRYEEKDGEKYKILLEYGEGDNIILKGK